MHTVHGLTIPMNGGTRLFQATVYHCLSGEASVMILLRQRLVCFAESGPNNMRVPACRQLQRRKSDQHDAVLTQVPHISAGQRTAQLQHVPPALLRLKQSVLQLDVTIGHPLGCNQGLGAETSDSKSRGAGLGCNTSGSCHQGP